MQNRKVIVTEFMATTDMIYIVETQKYLRISLPEKAAK